jgi:integrase
MKDLTQHDVNKLWKAGHPGRYRVSKNLYLQVKGLRSASWLFRYMLDSQVSVSSAGKRKRTGAHWMGLGSYPDVGLAEARQDVVEHRKPLKKDKVDPLAAKKAKLTAAKLAAAKTITFGECAREYVTEHSVSWKNGKHAAQWRATFEGSGRSVAATATINDLPVCQITTALVLKCLKPIWTETPETASRVRQRIETVLDFARAHEYRDGENPARWKGHLDHILPQPSKVKKVRHHPSLPYDELPAFMSELRANKFISARALEFMILTAARTGEIIGGTWDEVDFTKDTWTIPAERMKAGKEHKVPLPERVLALFDELPREDGNPYLFIGGKTGQPLSNMAMLELMKGMRPGYVPHGFRSTFRTWVAERTNYPNIVCELALGHTQSEKLMQAYQRGDLFEKRRRLMLEWEKFCSSPAPTSGTVVSLRAGEQVS